MTYSESDSKFASNSVSDSDSDSDCNSNFINLVIYEFGHFCLFHSVFVFF